MTSQLTTEEQDALDVARNLVNTRGSLHTSLLVYYIRQETGLDESEGEELLQRHGVYITDKYGNDAVASIEDEPSEGKTYSDSTDTESEDTETDAVTENSTESPASGDTNNTQDATTLEETIQLRQTQTKGETTWVADYEGITREGATRLNALLKITQYIEETDA